MKQELNEKWTQLLQICNHRKIPMEQIVQFKHIGAFDDQSAAMRRSVFKELAKRGFSNCQIAGLCGMTREGVRKALA